MVLNGLLVARPGDGMGDVEKAMVPKLALLCCWYCGNIIPLLGVSMPVACVPN